MTNRVVLVTGSSTGLGKAMALGYARAGYKVAMNYQNNKARAESAFAEFCESVEVGLSDYFVGPYGSYSSLDAIHNIKGCANHTFVLAQCISFRDGNIDFAECGNDAIFAIHRVGGRQ